MNKERIIYLDILRIIALFMVIVCHLCGDGLYNSPLFSFDWHASNIYDSLARFAVPLFIMISGILFLNQSHSFSIKKLYAKYIFRILIAFIFWSTLYGLFTSYSRSLTFDETIITIIKGHYHLWFLFIIVGLYIATPFFRNICKDKRLTEYFLVITLIFDIIIPTITTVIAPLLPDGTLKNVIFLINDTLKQLGLHAFSGFSFYYVLGYYLHTFLTSKKMYVTIICLGIFGFIITFGGTILATSITQEFSMIFYSNSSLGVMFEAIGLFAFIKLISTKHMPCPEKLITTLSQCSFGSYLMHAFFISLFSNVLNIDFSKGTWYIIPLASVLIFSITSLIAFLIRKIPIINRYII